MIWSLGYLDGMQGIPMSDVGRNYQNCTRDRGKTVHNIEALLNIHATFA
jgi:hypothetical protein